MDVLSSSPPSSAFLSELWTPLVDVVLVSKSERTYWYIYGDNKCELGHLRVRGGCVGARRGWRVVQAKDIRWRSGRIEAEARWLEEVQWPHW